jgi:hypothetical protein
MRKGVMTFCDDLRGAAEWEFPLRNENGSAE